MTESIIVTYVAVGLLLSFFHAIFTDFDDPNVTLAVFFCFPLFVVKSVVKGLIKGLLR